MKPPPAWECQRSVDADVPVSFAWQYMSDIRNWSDPPAEFALDGPFASASCGTTRMPGAPPMSWTLRDVDAGRGYTIEGGGFMDGAVLFVYWRFDALSGHRTRLMQKLELQGENAARYVDSIKNAFEPNLEPGLRRIADMMKYAAASRSRLTEPDN